MKIITDLEDNIRFILTDAAIVDAAEDGCLQFTQEDEDGEPHTSHVSDLQFIEVNVVANLKDSDFANSLAPHEYLPYEGEITLTDDAKAKYGITG